MLIVFKREDKGLYRKCENCPYFAELRDDKDVYPKTVGVICNAPQTVMATCFKYDWFRACARYNGESVKPTVHAENVDFNKIRESVQKLKRIGVKK